MIQSPASRLAYLRSGAVSAGSCIGMALRQASLRPQCPADEADAVKADHTLSLSHHAPSSLDLHRAQTQIYPELEDAVRQAIAQKVKLEDDDPQAHALKPELEDDDPQAHATCQPDLEHPS